MMKQEFRAEMNQSRSSHHILKVIEIVISHEVRRLKIACLIWVHNPR